MKTEEDTERSGRKRMLLVLVCAFIVTRVLNISLAYTPGNFGAAFGDLQKYETWATAIVEDRAGAYAEVEIEYPPGILPFITAAKLADIEGVQYGHRFIWVMVPLDAAALVVLLVLYLRGGSSLGAWVWIVGIVMLGPIVYLRLDLIPALATIFAVERMTAIHWSGAGWWLGFGAIAKIYPLFLLVAAWMGGKRRVRVELAYGAAVAVVLFLLPFLLIGSGDEMYDSVIGYHGARGIQAESSWGSALLTTSTFGYPVSADFRFGSVEVISGISGLLKNLGLVTSIAALSFGAYFVGRSARDRDAFHLAAGLYGLLALLMFFGTVFSPQYLVWLLALGSAALCGPLQRPLQIPLLLVLPLAALTQAVFPGTIGDVVAPLFEGAVEAGSLLGLIVLDLRNLGVLVAGVTALWGLHKVGPVPAS